MRFRKSWVLSARAIVYGSTPSFLAAALAWIPFLGWLIQFVAFVWSILLTIRGLKVLLAKPVAVATDASLQPTVVTEYESLSTR